MCMTGSYLRKNLKKFKKIYNSRLYDFSLNDNTLSNIISQWKAMSESFKNTTVLKNKYDKEGRLIIKNDIFRVSKN